MVVNPKFSKCFHSLIRSEWKLFTKELLNRTLILNIISRKILAICLSSFKSIKVVRYITVHTALNKWLFSLLNLNKINATLLNIAFFAFQNSLNKRNILIVST